jgi:hypothetical protein
MRFANPTPIRLGMTGKLSGADYRVVGRVVMGLVEDGETYSWNEFNLEADAGESATLVHEETESGGAWRFFTMFEPEYPITAEDAATKNVGDPLNLDGTDTHVTLVEQSRVYQIEGQAPEGVEVGDIANYFNTEGGDQMDVVSWTGEEVECYHGTTLTQQAVFAAFGIHRPDFNSLLHPGGDASKPSGLAAKVLIGSVVVIITLAAYISCSSKRRPPAATRISAPPSLLKTGSAGRLKGAGFRVQSHLLVEIAQVGCKFERHEYELASDSDSGGKALLVCGSGTRARDWILFTPLHPSEPLTPQQAGAIRSGETVNVDGITAHVSDLFQSTIRRMESPEADLLKEGDVLYGFAAKSGDVELLVRWNSSRIEFYQGQPLSQTEVTAAFALPQ